MSVARAQQEIDSKEFTEWRAFMKISPPMEERAGYYAALQCLTTVNSAPVKRRVTFKLEDFYIRFEDAFKKKGDKALGWKDIKSKLEHWKASIPKRKLKDVRKNRKKG